MEALQASEARLAEACAMARLGAWELDVTSGEITCSVECKENLGLEPDAALSRARLLGELIHADDRGEARARLEAAVAGDGSFDARFRNLRADGSIRWLEARGRVIRGAGGNGRGARVVGFLQDITDHVAVEEAQRASEERLSQAIRVAGFGIYEHDHRTGTVYLSPKLREICGLGPDEPFSLTALFERVLSEDQQAVTDAVARAHDPAGDGLYESEHRIVWPDGEVRWVSTQAQTFFEGEGPARRPVRTVGAMIDITEHKRAEEALREAARRKDEFLATLAHELRNPLAPLCTGLQLLRGSPETAERAREMMERQLKHMVRLIDDLLDVSRISRGKVELRRERIELRAVIDAALEASRPVLEAEGHALSVRLPSGAVWLEGDLTRLAQVVVNLLNNAAKYTPRGGRVELAAETDAREVTISVRDDGAGITPEMLPHVFDMFTQVDRTLGRSRGGLGIGLTLVRSLVELHGGSVEAQSAGAGQGSTFTVRLPMLEMAAAAPEPPPSGIAEPSPSAGRVRVLVVDDNLDAAESLSLFLELLGHEVRTANSGPEALTVAYALRPDVVVCDIGMPGMDGYEVCRHLRARPEIAGAMIVALTGWGGEDDRRRSREAGFDHHLTKPVDPAQVDALIAGRSGQ